MTTIDAATVTDLIERRASATPDAPMLFDERDRTMSFGEYRDQVERMAAALARRGVTRGWRVAWQLPTRMETVVLAGALARLGALQAMLLPQYRQRELDHILGEVRPQLVIVPGSPEPFDYLDQARTAAAPLAGVEVLALEQLAADAGDAPAPRAAPPTGDEVRWIIYTSGTTGSPKGVKHADRTVIAGARALYYSYQYRPSDRTTVAYPFSHIGGIMVLCTALAVGSSIVLVDRFDARAHIALFRRLQVTLPGSGPMFFRLFLEAQREQPGTSILPDARAFVGGGAPKPPGMHAELKTEIGGFGILGGYGMSECPMITAIRPGATDEQVDATEGSAVADTEIRIVSGDGTEVAPGGEGEIRVRGPQLFLGYVDATLDAGAFDERGFFRTGDLGRLRPDGHLTLTGRVKDVIIRKGENISAKEVEDILTTHPKVDELAVIGLPDTERGELCCAVVVGAEGTDPLTFDEMTDWVRRAGLARHKVPERLELVDALPRNVTGKVQKAALRKRYEGTVHA
jgi:acyl-CoA synthetase (AMP-forming)/AMP-acid ligase II